MKKTIRIPVTIKYDGEAGFDIWIPEMPWDRSWQCKHRFAQYVPELTEKKCKDWLKCTLLLNAGPVETIKEEYEVYGLVDKDGDFIISVGSDEMDYITQLCVPDKMTIKLLLYPAGTAFGIQLEY